MITRGRGWGLGGGLRGWRSMCTSFQLKDKEVLRMYLEL